MNYSIRKKMFVITITTTLCSFLLILVAFNLIIRNHIEKESTSQLKRAVSSAKCFSITEKPNYDIVINASDTLPENGADKETIVSSDAESVIGYIGINMETLENASSDLDFFLTNSSDDSLVYPSFLTDANNNPPHEGKGVSRYYKENEINGLQDYIKNHSAQTPQRVRLNNTNYYIMEADIGGIANAVFYKNIQPLENLATTVNIILVVLLFLSGLITIAATMGLTNGMVQSIQKLCRFANDIGSGNLKQQNLSLKETELAVLEQDMNEMAKKLSIHDAEQKTFFQNVSHELKTPLMSIQGYAEGITSHVFEEEQAYEAADIILAESDRLTVMINNLLCLSRMDSADRVEKKENFEVTEALRETIEQVQTMSGAKEITYQQTGDEMNLYGNRDAFQKALTNILTNGIRYAVSTVSVVCDTQNHSIIIADDGNGIADKDMPHIFKRFYKGEKGCSGIGLAIAQTAIHNIGGTIDVKNDNGAVFTISLPMFH